jgi:hypothetical protein
MKYGVKIDSGVMMYIPSIIKTDFRRSEVDRGGSGGIRRHRQQDDLISLIFFKTRKTS